MRTLLFTTIALALCCSTAHAVASLSATPLVHESANGTLNVELTVDEYRVTGTPVEFTTRAYNGAIPGPTLKFQAGDKIHLKLNNHLGPQTGTSTTHNSFHRPNTTNVHTHGLHVSSEGDADNIFRTAEPGESLEYNYDIPETHHPGTHWYHAHVHGATNLQVAGGLAGVLVVKDDPAEAPAELLAMPDFTMLIHRWTFGQAGIRNPYLDLVNAAELSGSTLDMNVQQVGSTSNFHVINGQYQPMLTLSPKEWVRLRFVNGDNGAYVHLVVPGCETALLAADGIYLDAPDTSRNIILAPGSRRDVALKCDTAGSYNVQCATDVLGGGAGVRGGGGGGGGGVGDVCTGVLARVTVEGAAHPTSLPTTLPARRHYVGDDLRTLSNADIDGTFRFAMNGGGGGGVAVGNAGIVVAVVIVGIVLVVLHIALVCSGLYAKVGLPTLCCKRGGGAQASGPTRVNVRRTSNTSVASSVDVRPAVFSLEAGAPVYTADSKSSASGCCGSCKRYGVNWVCMAVLLLFVGAAVAVLVATGGVVTGAQALAGTWQVNGRAFGGETDVSHTMRLNTVEEWTIAGGAGGFAHPGHVHIYPMQLQSIGGGAQEMWGFKVGGWYDTIPGLGGASVMRIPIRTFTGKVIMHCHILGHEDLGMMAMAETVA